MSRFRWYREWRNGFWVYEHFVGWRKVDQLEHDRIRQYRLGSPAWSFEEY